MLIPTKQKFRKQMRGRMKGNAQKGNKVEFGEFGLKALGRGYLSSKQIESARKAITNCTKRSGKLWIRVFPNKPITKDPLATHMGGGKGPVEKYVFIVKPGRVIFEIAGIDEKIAKEAFRKATDKFGFKTKFIEK